MASDPQHNWISLDHYLNLHAASLQHFDHFVEQNNVNIEITALEYAFVEGRLNCAGGTYLEIRAFLRLDERNRIRSLRYAFHAGMRGTPDRVVFRYDNAHGYLREGQPDAHHKHRFDVVTGREIEPPEWIGHDRTPTLYSVLAELEQWWLETGQFLELP